MYCSLNNRINLYTFFTLFSLAANASTNTHNQEFSDEIRQSNDVIWNTNDSRKARRIKISGTSIFVDRIIKTFDDLTGFKGLEWQFSSDSTSKHSVAYLIKTGDSIGENGSASARKLLERVFFNKYKTTIKQIQNPSLSRVQPRSNFLESEKSLKKRIETKGTGSKIYIGLTGELNEPLVFTREYDQLGNVYNATQSLEIILVHELIHADRLARKLNISNLGNNKTNVGILTDYPGSKYETILIEEAEVIGVCIHDEHGIDIKNKDSSPIYENQIRFERGYGIRAAYSANVFNLGDINFLRPIGSYILDSKKHPLDLKSAMRVIANNLMVPDYIPYE